MGQFSNLDIVFRNWFPEESDYDKYFIEFYEWLNDENRNMQFMLSNNPGSYLDLCNNTSVHTDDVCSYWCEHVKLNIHNGEGFVINQ